MDTLIRRIDLPLRPALPPRAYAVEDEPPAAVPPSSSPRERVDPLASSFATSYAGVVAFLAVVDEGSFAKAGDRLGIGRSAVSRSVRKLEAQLDARLFQRSTRRTSLTREGELFHANCRPGVDRIVQAMEDLRELRDGPPRGALRIGATPGFGRRVVAPLLPGFHAKYPDISLELRLDDRPADFIADRIDVSFRHGTLEDSEVVARPLIPMRRLLCASPDYVLAHGMPGSVEDLAGHRTIHHRLPSGRLEAWEFKVDGHPRRWSPPTATHTFNDADLVLQAALDGQGLAQMAGYQACGPLRSGALVACLARHAPDDGGHSVCYLGRRHLPARIRVFIDHMTTAIRALDLDGLGSIDTRAA